MILGSLFLCGCLLQGQAGPDPGKPRVGPAPPTYLWVTPLTLDIPVRPEVVDYRIPRPSRLAGAALVEVWSETPWELSERMRLVRVELAPKLAQAFKAGAAISNDALMLNEFMANWQEFKTPTVPAVYYNAQRPVEDPELAREGIHMRVGYRANLLLGQPNR